MSKIEFNPVVMAASILGLSSVFMDWFNLRANRIVSGQGLGYFESLGTALGLILISIWLVTMAFALIGSRWSKIVLPV